MTKQTQCPHCLSVFVITDDQLQKSRGKVRCGSCRQPFRASLLAEDYYEKKEEEEDFQFFEDISPRTQDSAPHRHKAWPSPKQPVEEIIQQTRSSDSIKTDDDGAAIEESVSVEEALEKALNTDLAESGLDLSRVDADSEATSFTEETPRFFDEPLSEASVDQLTGRNIERSSEIEWASISSHSDYSAEFVKNFTSESSSSIDGDSLPSSDKYWDDELSITEEASEQNISQIQVEINLPDASSEPPVQSENAESTNLNHQEVEPVSAVSKTDIDVPFDDEQQLIDEVDQLIEEKLLVEKDSSSVPHEFHVGQRSSAAKGETSGFARAMARLLLGLSVVVLLALLITQLWYRQALALFENDKIAKIITPIVEPIKQTLEEQFSLTLPVRRDLSKMHLLSVQSEVHPTRSTTQLLKVSLVNQAEIGQPYPWFELVLTDEDGRLVSRRSLSPNDYLHNNQLSGWMGPKELRRITIELLAFPKQAHGYELRVLNN